MTRTKDDVTCPECGHNDNVQAVELNGQTGFCTEHGKFDATHDFEMSDVAQKYAEENFD